MDLHNKILNIQPSDAISFDFLAVRGHREARHSAAELATEFCATLPAWHDRPTGPGRFDGKNGRIYTITDHDWELQPSWLKHWEGGRVYGPIPADTKGTETK